MSPCTVNDRHVEDDIAYDDDTYEKERIYDPKVIVSQKLAQFDNKASIAHMLESICLDDDESAVKEPVKSVPPPPPPLTHSNSNSETKSSSSELIVDSASAAQLTREFNEARIENEAIDRWGDILQKENDILQDLLNFIKDHIQMPNTESAFITTKKRAKYINRSLLKVQDIMSREKAFLCSRITFQIFEIIGQRMATPSKLPSAAIALSESQSEETWQEEEDGNIAYCFRCQKIIGHVTATICVLRINSKWRRLSISSRDWLQDVKILGRNINSVSISSSNKAEVFLVRQCATHVEIDTFVFGSSFYSMLFVKQLTATLLGDASYKNRASNAQVAIWSPNCIDTSGIELPPELADLAYFVNERLKKYWQAFPAKQWLKSAANAVLLDQERHKFLTGGRSSSITMEFAETVMRATLILNFSITSQKEAPSHANDRHLLISYLADNVHSHWCMVVSRLQELAAKGYTRDAIPARKPEYFREVAFDRLPPEEKQEYVEDVKHFIDYIEEFGYSVVRNKTSRKKYFLLGQKSAQD